MITISKNQLVKRTRLMLPKQAQAFAKCLRANPKFTTSPVEVHKSNRTDDPIKCFYVQWIPLSLETRHEMLNGFADSREKRARAQQSNYQFAPCEDRPGWYYCISATGEFYVVHPLQGCDAEGHGCPDMLFRGNQIGQYCKHYYCLNTWLDAQVQQPEVKVAA